MDEAIARRNSLRSLPGVANATFVIPAAFDSGKVTTDDPDLSRATQPMGMRNAPRIVDAEFFRTFGVPVRGGFNPVDDGSTPTAVIDSVAARTLFGDGDPIGHMIKLGPPRSTVPWIRVVGVSRHVRWRMPNGAITSTMDPQVYLLDRRAVAPPFRTGDAMWYVRPADDLEATFAAVRERTPSASLTLFDDANWRNMFDRMITYIAGLFTAFAAVGLALAMIGVYGVLAHSVSQRTREFGVRIALGATTGDFVRLVLTQANMPVLVGIALGCSPRTRPRASSGSSLPPS
jgi:putative ABC transport system permease protein